MPIGGQAARGGAGAELGSHCEGGATGRGWGLGGEGACDPAAVHALVEVHRLQADPHALVGAWRVKAGGVNQGGVGDVGGGSLEHREPRRARRGQ